MPSMDKIDEVHDGCMMGVCERQDVPVLPGQADAVGEGTHGVHKHLLLQVDIVHELGSRLHHFRRNAKRLQRVYVHILMLEQP